MAVDMSTVVEAMSAALRKSVEELNHRREQDIRSWVDDELVAMEKLTAHVAAVSGVVDAASTPADFVQVGEFVADYPSYAGKSPAAVVSLRVGVSDGIGRGSYHHDCDLAPAASGISVCEVVRAMSGKDRGLRDGKRYRVLIMAWEQTEK